eukprot:8572643-Pyramimonas_sp.AAC.1
MTSACVVWPLSQVAGDRVASARRGFLRGRQLIDGSIEVDAALFLGHAVCGARRKALLFLLASRVSECSSRLQ